MKGSGLGRQNGRQANKDCRTGTAGGHSQRILRPAQASNKRPQIAGLAAKKKTTAADDVLPLIVQVGGGSAVVLKKAGADLPTVPTPPNAFACHCPYPLP